MESYRKPTRSQDRKAEGEYITDQSRLQPQQPYKAMPHTTTNQANNKSAKQRSFVDEITKLTQQVERELGLSSSHHAGRTQSTHLTGQSKMVLMKQQAKSYLNDTADSGAPNDKTNLTSFRNDNRVSHKQAQRREKMSNKVQKFIERKKREEIIKRSLEQTIEVEKQQKIL
jgi:hypothetical protein